MDTDDLSDEAYAIIREAHRASALLGAELAVSGATARSEHEFLECMLIALRDARGCPEDYVNGDHPARLSRRDATRLIERCRRSAEALLLRTSDP